MDKDILSRREIDSITTELEESETITAKIITYKKKLEEMLPVLMPATSVSPSPMVHASLTPPATVVKP